MSVTTTTNNNNSSNNNNDGTNNNANNNLPATKVCEFQCDSERERGGAGIYTAKLFSQLVKFGCSYVLFEALYLGIKFAPGQFVLLSNFVYPIGANL